MPASRRIVLTGIGIINPLGAGPDAVWQNLLAGKSGVRTVQAFNAGACPSHIAGEIPGFDAKNYIDKKDRKNLRVMARPIQFAVSAAQMALNDGKVDKSRLEPRRFGVVFGANAMPSEVDELAPAGRLCVNCDRMRVDLQAWGEKGLPAVTPLWLLKYLPNMLACHVSILHNAQGPSNSITEGDVASLMALGEACRILGRNHADFFLVGGADSILHPIALSRHNLFLKLSQRNDAPERACRPFDLGRDGMVVGEGGCVLAVEELSHAQARGARIYAELAGFGAAFDRGRTGRGVARAMHNALAAAQITPDDIDHVNAHASGSVPNDAWEARAIHEVFGGCKEPVPVFAPKSYFGNLYAGSGTSELAASILALVHGQLPRTLNYESPDPACPVHVIREVRPVTKPHFMKLGLDDMGQCAAVVCRKWE
jgi:3-oxoacyl-[acyl-carrier-protein] synthase II